MRNGATAEEALRIHLADKFVAALVAGGRAGGDRREEQRAAPKNLSKIQVALCRELQQIMKDRGFYKGESMIRLIKRCFKL